MQVSLLASWFSILRFLDFFYLLPHLVPLPFPQSVLFSCIRRFGSDFLVILSTMTFNPPRRDTSRSRSPLHGPDPHITRHSPWAVLNPLHSLLNCDQ